MFHRLLLPFALSAALAHAHPELEQALARLNSAIAAEPARAELYLQRGELYARHEDWPAAEANYRRAAELAPLLLGLDRAQAALALTQRHWREAREFATAALSRDPRDAEAFVLRARSHAALGDRRAALQDMDAALTLIAEPRAELFLERAGWCESPADALRGLDAAMARIGPVHTLQLRALEIEETSARSDAALARLDDIIAAAELRDPWLKRRGDLLARIGRIDAAQIAYRAALDAIERLPAWWRASPAVAERASVLHRLVEPVSNAP